MGRVGRSCVVPLAGCPAGRVEILEEINYGSRI